MILKRFYEDNLARELSPSQKRYVGYFSGLVTGALILQDRLIYLHAVVYRNPGRGRFFTTALETIAENNNNAINGNSVYAHPEEFVPQPRRVETLEAVIPPEEWSPEGVDTENNLMEWYRAGGMELRAMEAGMPRPCNGGFPTDQEELCRLTKSIETEMRGGRRFVVDDTNVRLARPKVETTMRSFVDADGGLQIKIYQNLKLMHTTRLLCPNVNITVEKYIFPIEPILPLHGDILIACCLRPDITTSIQEIIFRLQFHTCAISNERMNFYKHDLDEACSDMRFPPTGCVELYFSSDPILLQEHNDNLDRGGYQWTSADRESSILSIGIGGERQRVLPRHGILVTDQTRRDRTFPAVEQQQLIETRKPLSILITTQEYIITAPSALFTGQIQITQAPMWSDAGIHGKPGDRVPRGPLLRQASDPLSHPTIRGRSLPAGLGPWSSYSEPGPVPGPSHVPLFQQALLSPRIQLPPAGSGPSQLEPLGGARPTSFQSTALNGGGLQGQINRLSLAQLQALYQQLLQQYEQLLQQQQQRQQQHQQQQLDQAGVPIDSTLYATVQRPTGTNLLNLLTLVQRAIAQQQRQPTAFPGLQYPQVPPGSANNAAQLLSGLSTSTALTNLARALLPTATMGVPPSEQPSLPRVPMYAAQPSPLAPTLQYTPQGLAYLPTQARPGVGSLQNVTAQQQQPLLDSELERLYLELLAARTSISLQPSTAARIQTLLATDTGLQTGEFLTDPQLLAEQRRRDELQRTRVLLSDQERRLFEELRALRQRRAGLARQEAQARIPSGAPGLTPLESYRRATGRMAASESLRSRGQSRAFQSVGRSGSADAARIPYGDTYELEQSEDAALLALLEQRLARTDARHLLSDVEAGYPDKNDIPIKAVGPQQRSGHVVDGSSQAILGEGGPGGAVRVFLPAESQLIEPSVMPRVGSPIRAQLSSGEYAALSDLGLPYEGLSVPTPLDPMHPGVNVGEMEREMDVFSRQPRIHLEGSPTEAVEGRYLPPAYGAPGRNRTYSGSPTMHSGHGPPPFRTTYVPSSPSRRPRQWGQSSYDEQTARFVDISPGVSPVRTPSTRLLRSPVSPPLRPSGYDRRHGGGVLDTGSQSDTGLIGDYGRRGWSSHEYGGRRPYRTSRSGRMDIPHQRGRPQNDRLFHSPGRVPGLEEFRGYGTLDHVPEAALITLNRLSASTHIWYRPEMSRTQSIDLVRADPPGTFVVRNSGSFPRSFGLVVKVSRAQQADTGDESEVVRHYLIEGLPTSPSVMSQAIGVPAASLAPSNVPMGPTAMSVTHGPVRLRGCSNEPIFTNLVSLLYEHVVQPLALPFALRLPFKSPAPTSNLPSLIALSSRSGEPMDRAARPHRHPTGGHLSEDSPRGPGQRGHLTRHPSDPLPGDVSVAAVGSYYSSSHPTGQLPPGQYPSGRQDGLAPPHSRGPFSQGRSPPSAYETEFGPMPFGGPSGKWRTFTSIYLGSIDTENLTGSSAIRKAVDVLLENSAQVKQTEVTIKVTQDGLTVTDNWRKLFFRRHYPLFSVSYCAIDPAQRCWESQELRAMGFKASRIFGFVARKQNTRENMCHVFCDTPDCSCSTITEYIMYRLNDY
ncbi:hypothetical protein CRM22_010685 [Opisthorchis felineus]|nr:hypothetical protein CRM22_010685 [Opisthorchis felineus]